MHSPHLGTIPRLASAPTRHRLNVTVVEIPREITRKETQSDANPESKPGRNKSEKTERPKRRHPNKRSFQRRTASFEQEQQLGLLREPRYRQVEEVDAETLTVERNAASRALQGVIDDVAYPLYAERNVPGNPEARQMATERILTYTTARWNPPASHDPRAGRCGASPLDQHVGSRVRGWTLAGAANMYHRPHSCVYHLPQNDYSYK